MLPHEVTDEDQLLRYINTKWHLGEFGKIYGISTNKISPDIDLLRLEQSTRTVIGYEFKIINYHKAWKRANLTPIYTGIGQTLTYFNFGVDISNLVLGISPEMPEDVIPPLRKTIEEVIMPLKCFKQVADDLQKQVFFGEEFSPIDLTGMMSKYSKGIGCIGVLVWNGHDDTLTTLLKAEKVFPMGNELIHKHNCLLKKEFKSKIKF